MRDALRWHVEGIVDPHARIDAARAAATAARAHAVRRGAGGESLSAPPAADSLLYHDALAETNAFPVDHRVRRACGDSGPALPLRRGAPRRPRQSGGQRARCARRPHRARAAARCVQAADVPPGRPRARRLASDRGRLVPRADRRAPRTQQPAAAAQAATGGACGRRIPRARRRLAADRPSARQGRALVVLADAWPDSLRYGELAPEAAVRLASARDDATLLAALLESYRRHAIELHAVTLRHETSSSRTRADAGLLALLDRRPLAEGLGLGQRAERAGKCSRRRG